MIIFFIKELYIKYDTIVYFMIIQEINSIVSGCFYSLFGIITEISTLITEKFIMITEMFIMITEKFYFISENVTIFCEFFLMKHSLKKS